MCICRAKAGGKIEDAYAEMAASHLLLPLLMGEDSDLLYIQAEERLSPSEASEIPNASTPVIVCCGDPFHSELFYIVFEKEVVLEANELTEAIELLFSFFYVMNIEYPKKSCTYTFYQKQVCNIKDEHKVPIKLVSFVEKLR